MSQIHSQNSMSLRNSIELGYLTRADIDTFLVSARILNIPITTSQRKYIKMIGSLIATSAADSTSQNTSQNYAKTYLAIRTGKFNHIKPLAGATK